MGLIDRIISKTLPFAPRFLVRSVASRYIAGATLDDAMNSVAALNAEGAMATIDVLGEFVRNEEVAKAETEQSIRVLEEIHRRGLQANLSVKLTSLGLDIDTEFCYANLRAVVACAASLASFVRTDMENTPYTQRTIDLQRRLRVDFPDSVGIVMQAYLRRCYDDVVSLADEGANFRLCKGIYIEPPDLAFQSREEVQANFLRCLEAIVDRGCYVGIATHDDVLIEGARRIIDTRRLRPDQYEFQMLLGVRDSRRRELIAQGHRMRVYVPFGQDWYGYSIRRLKENPAIAGHVLRSLFKRR